MIIIITVIFYDADPYDILIFLLAVHTRFSWNFRQADADVEESLVWLGDPT